MFNSSSNVGHSDSEDQIRIDSGSQDAETNSPNKISDNNNNSGGAAAGSKPNQPRQKKNVKFVRSLQQLAGKEVEEEEEDNSLPPRIITLNNPQKNKEQKFADNRISTTKYNLFTFLPKNLFEQFSRIANFYFLMLAIIQLIPGITPISPVSSIVPLVFVLGVTAVKDAIEDIRRRRMDNEINHTSVEVVRNGAHRTVQWADLSVGDIVYVKNNQHIPADLVIVSTDDVKDGLCYIETANLDGETNLKVRQSIEAVNSIRTPEELSAMVGEIECEPPNKRLYAFEGKLTLNDKVYSLSAKQILLRGTVLKNSKWAYGITIFTGHETKLMKNANKTPSKKSNLEQKMNSLIKFLFIFLGGLVVLSAIGTTIFTEYLRYTSWYFGTTIQDTNGAIAGLLSLLVFIILYNTFVPISLYVVMELVKVSHAYFINNDVEMYDKESNTPAKARSTSLGEELGQIQYIFSDKTGTLTCNVMEFLKCSIAGVAYGTGTTEIGRASARREGRTIEDSRPEGLKFERGNRLWDARLNDGVWKSQPDAAKIREFFLTLAICHTVIPEPDANDPSVIKYQAASPDENALVVAAKAMGFAFKSRSPEEVVVDVEGEGELRYTILNIIEFNSDRKRMSVIVRCPDGRIKLMSKGADTEIYKRLVPDCPYKEETLNHLSMFGDSEGLRTLAVAACYISEEAYNQWSEIYYEASIAIGKREEKIDAAAELIEKDLVLIGATAIEDKLQDGVPECIEMLAKASIQLWVLTGDKQETAINIGFACSLLDDTMKLVVVNGRTADIVRNEIEKAIETFDNSRRVALIINGTALQYALSKELKELLLTLSMRCKVVVCCRVTPSQKADVVKMVKKKANRTTLAIGDGANDVAMIQAAHIGVGISGHEGMQAVMASDYAIAQFRFLSRLLLVHGRWNYQRMAKLIMYSFYKNIVFTLTQFWFACVSSFSGITLHDSWHVSLFNVIFTFLPIFILAVFDQDIKPETMMKVPMLYTPGQNYAKFNLRIFMWWVIESIYQATVVFWFGIFLLGVTSTYQGMQYNTSVIGAFVFYAVIVIVNLRLALELKYWTPITHIAVWATLLSPFVFSLIYNVLPPVVLDVINSDNSALSMYWVLYDLAIDPMFWLSLILCVIIAMLPSFSSKFYYLHFRGSAARIIREREILGQTIEPQMALSLIAAQQTTEPSLSCDVSTQSMDIELQPAAVGALADASRAVATSSSMKGKGRSKTNRVTKLFRLRKDGSEFENSSTYRGYSFSGASGQFPMPLFNKRLSVQIASRRASLAVEQPLVLVDAETPEADNNNNSGESGSQPQPESSTANEAEHRDE